MNRSLTFADRAAWRGCRAFAADQSGVGLVEFALALPIAILLLIGLFDFGAMTARSMALGNAARVGAQFAQIDPDNSAGIEAGVRSSGGLGSDALTVSSREFCECPNGVAVSCTGTCAGNAQRQEFLEIAVSQEYAPLIPYPLLTGSAVTLERAVTFRVR